MTILSGPTSSTTLVFQHHNKMTMDALPAMTDAYLQHVYHHKETIHSTTPSSPLAVTSPSLLLLSETAATAVALPFSPCTPASAFSSLFPAAAQALQNWASAHSPTSSTLPPLPNTSFTISDAVPQHSEPIKLYPLDTSYDTDATTTDSATTDLDSSGIFSSCFSSPIMPTIRSAGSLENSHDRDLLRQRMAALHKPARGRQRAKQLNEMTEEEREVERELIMEKNRLAARDCRVRKKSFIHTLEDKIKAQDALHEKQQAIILALQQENAKVKADLQQVLQDRQRQEIVTREVYNGGDEDGMQQLQPLAKKVKTK
jgi:hypothetical protein